MKKVLLVFIAIMCFGLTGCDNDEEMGNDISLSFFNLEMSSIEDMVKSTSMNIKGEEVVYRKKVGLMHR